MNTTTQTKTDIKTIDIQAKEWFDKVNGNSYWSAQITINFGMPNSKTIYVPFQYGYGTQYEYSSLDQLCKDGILPSEDQGSIPWKYWKERNVSYRYNKQVNCLKRDVIAWGRN